MLNLNHLVKLYESYFSEKCTGTFQLPLSGSNRLYFKLSGEKNKAIGTYNTVKKENEAFIHFSKVFKEHGLKVPEVYAEDIENHVYIQEYVGDLSVFELINDLRKHPDAEEKITILYKKILEDLIKFQTTGGTYIDFSKAYPVSAFNAQSIMWDLNYFKYYFLKLLNIDFDEQKLELDFQKLSTYLSSCNCVFFMYRDFQSRNIIINNDTLHYIDFQGGRKGPLYYDLASLLFNAKAKLSNAIRGKLLNFYKELSEKYIEKGTDFNKEFYAFVLIRILQTFGAYGYRGLFERKIYFIESIPIAINNLKNIISDVAIFEELPELQKAISAIINLNLEKEGIMKKEQLKITLRSFSYKRGIPYDLSGNGGGFTFDCRGIPNPGRIEEFKTLTGNDKEVISYIDNIASAKEFLDAAHKIISINIDNYIERGFSNLSVNFGCTGGQHRSVYCTNKTHAFLKKTYPNIEVDFKHCEL